MNCDEKVNTQSLMSVSCRCRNCDVEGFTDVSYEWELHVKGKWKEMWYTVPGLSEKAMTDVNLDQLVLKKNTLGNGRSYRLTCCVKNEGKRSHA